MIRCKTSAYQYSMQLPHTFAATSAVKIVENHTGRAFIKQYTPSLPPQTVQIDPNQQA